MVHFKKEKKAMSVRRLSISQISPIKTENIEDGRAKEVSIDFIGRTE